MSLLNLFKKEPVKYINEESLPSITLVISRIEELEARKPVYEEFKIRKAKIDYTNHSGPVEFLKNNIKLWNNDHYFEAKHQVKEGNYAIKEKDESTGKTSKVKKPVFIHTFNFDYYAMVPYQGITNFSEPDENASIPKEKHTLLNAVLTLYTPKHC